MTKKQITYIAYIKDRGQNTGFDTINIRARTIKEAKSKLKKRMNKNRVIHSIEPFSIEPF